MDKHPTWTRYEMDNMRMWFGVHAARTRSAMMQFGVACECAAAALDALTKAYGPIEEQQSGEG